MVKKIQAADGKVYKKVAVSNNTLGRKRTVEMVFGIISLVLSLGSLASGFRMASVADAFGGGGAYTAELLFGILLSAISFALVFFINKKHIVIGIAIIVLGVVLIFSCGEFGIIGGFMFTITGIISLVRK